MQDRYNSLEPTFQDEQIRYDRYNATQKLMKEASGGQTAQNLGFLFGLTFASMIYVRAERNGFTMLPLAKYKANTYAKIFGIGYLGYLFGHSLVSSMTGDMKYYRYLIRNETQILKGSKPMEPSTQ